MRYSVQLVRRFTILIMLMFVVLVNNAVATPKEMTIGDAMGLALRNNRDVQIAYLERVIDKFDLKVAEDKFNPDVEFYANAYHLNSRYERDDNSLEKSETTNIDTGLSLTNQLKSGGEIMLSQWRSDYWRKNNTSSTDKSEITRWRADIRQPLLKGFGSDVATASVRWAQLQEQSNLLNLKESLTTTVNSVIVAFRDYSAAGQSLKIRQAAVAQAQNLVELNRSLIASGKLPGDELVQAELDLAVQEYELETARNDYDNAGFALLDVLELESDTPIIPGQDIVLPEVMPDVDACILLALENREDYLNAEIVFRQAEIDLLLAKDNKKWDLDAYGDVTYGHSYYSSSPGGDGTDVRVGLKLYGPLYGDLTREQRVVDAQTKVQQTALKVDQLRNRIDLDVKDAVRYVNISSRQANMAIKTRQLAEQQLRVERDKFNKGQSSNFELITFMNKLTDSLQVELDARQAYANAWSDLDTVLGVTLDTWQVDYNEENNKFPTL